MTLEEAIKHCEEIAELKYDEGNEARLQEQDKYADECVVCAAKHRQLAGWLKELKERREKDVPDTNDPISRQAAIDAAKDWYDGLICGSFKGLEKRLKSLPSIQPEPTLEQIKEYCHKRCLSIVDNALLCKYAQAEIHPKSARTFVELVVEYPDPELCTYKEYKGKPYYSIKYIENGETYVGYGTYNPKVMSQYLKEYFISSTASDIIHCKECKFAHMTTGGECKYCDVWFPDESEYLDGDYFCASAERREE